MTTGAKKGKELYVADTLSRAYPKYIAENGSDQLDEDFEIMTVWPLSSPRTEQLKQGTADDIILKKVAQAIQQGWLC